MKDKQFLNWLHDWLMEKHGENPDVDYMRKLRNIAEATPENKLTPSVNIPK